MRCTRRTFARVMNSSSTGCAGCSRPSRTRVRGLAESRRLSSFCSSSRLCERLWTAFGAAMFADSRRSGTHRQGRLKWTVRSRSDQMLLGGWIKVKMPKCQNVWCPTCVAHGPPPPSIPPKSIDGSKPHRMVMRCESSPMQWFESPLSASSWGWQPANVDSVSSPLF